VDPLEISADRCPLVETHSLVHRCRFERDGNEARSAPKRADTKNGSDRTNGSGGTRHIGNSLMKSEMTKYRRREGGIQPNSLIPNALPWLVGSTQPQCLHLGIAAMKIVAMQIVAMKIVASKVRRGTRSGRTGRRRKKSGKTGRYVIVLCWYHLVYKTAFFSPYKW
jgi:hypothetical protein